MPASTQVVYPSGRTIAFTTGVGLHDVSLLASGNGWSSASLTARAGGGQANATPIRQAMNLVAVCATAGDSVQLPPAAGGQNVWIANGGAASCQIYCPPGTDTINGAVNGTGIALAAGKSIELFCPLTGSWFGVLSA